MLMATPYTHRTLSLLLLTLLSMVASCAPFQPETTPPEAETTKAVDAIDMSDSAAVTSRLMKQYREWQKTPYRIGGLSKNGIDCSGFVHITFRKKLGFSIPRTTELQVQAGSTIDRASLRAGDLVFFKTGMFTNHVGMYLYDSKFLHASTSKGVMVSSLKQKYWHQHYWVAKRVGSM